MYVGIGRVQVNLFSQDLSKKKKKNILHKGNTLIQNILLQYLLIVKVSFLFFQSCPQKLIWIMDFDMTLYRNSFKKIYTYTFFRMSIKSGNLKYLCIQANFLKVAKNVPKNNNLQKSELHTCMSLLYISVTLY